MRGSQGACLVVSWLLIVAPGLLAAEHPVAVSPGSGGGVSLVESRCPTFSWAGVSAARSYELVVYKADESAGHEEPVVRIELPGTASAWTPSVDRCLVRGGWYAWSVRAWRETTAGDWSEPSVFQVVDRPSRAEPAAPMEISGQTTTGAPSAGPVKLRPGTRKLDCNRGGRYEDNGDGTVTDCRTGLVWLRDASCDELGGTGNWENMMAAAAGLADGMCGLTDGSYPGFWRLPTVAEFMEMVASANKLGFDYPSLTNAKGDAKWTTDGDAFVGVEHSCCEYWTSSEIDTGGVWDLNMRTGDLDIDGKFSRNWVWPVRSGLPTTTRIATGSPNATCSDSEMLVGGGCDCGNNAVRTSTAIDNGWSCKCDGSPFNGNATAVCLRNP